MWLIASRSPPFRTYLKSEYGLAFVARAFAVQKNHLLCLLLHKQLLKSGSISLPWALLCLRSVDVVFMQSGPFMVLNSIQLEGYTSKDVRWSPMLLFTSSLASHKRSSPLAAHFQESCHFLFVFSFLYTGFAFLFFFVLLFCWRLIAALSWTAAATCCETNSLECEWKFLIVKARLLTLTPTGKRTKDESSWR